MGCLIEGADKKWIVFLNEDWETFWYYTRARPRGYSEIAARVAQLESIPIDHLSDDARRSFGVLVGQGMARVFDDDGPELANVVLDQAEEFINARLAEKSRLWYVVAGLVAAIAIVVVLTAAADLKPEAWKAGLLPTGAAGLGACASLLARKHKLPNDPNAGWILHVIEAAARIGVGLLSGWLVLLASEADIIIAQGTGAAGLLLIAFAAGATERFVPDLVARVGGDRVAGSPKPDKMGEAARSLVQNRGRNNGGKPNDGDDDRQPPPESGAKGKALPVETVVKPEVGTKGSTTDVTSSAAVPPPSERTKRRDDETT